MEGTVVYSESEHPIWHHDWGHGYHFRLHTASVRVYVCFSQGSEGGAEAGQQYRS